MPMTSQQQTIKVSKRELPLACPRPGDEVWNMHPRVYLSFKGGVGTTVTCPYCGANYQLTETEPA